MQHGADYRSLHYAEANVYRSTQTAVELTLHCLLRPVRKVHIQLTTKPDTGNGVLSTFIPIQLITATNSVVDAVKDFFSIIC